MHHNIEEEYFFPLLAKRMPAFSPDQKHKNAHKAIHAGLDNLERLVNKYTADPSCYSPQEMKKCLDSFRDVLVDHLAEEVRELGAENMKKYWTLDEVMRLPI